MISTNGAPPAPAAAGKPPARQATTFLPALPLDTWRMRLYALTRGQWLGMALIRWLYLLLAMLAFVWGAFAWPGGWLASLGWLLGGAVLAMTVREQQRRHFSTFLPQMQPLPAPRPMPSAEKRSLYVTGMLSVEQKSRSFTALPGFYRTFATREHALLCQVQARSLLRFAAWPEEEIGLWYTFFMPDQILAIQPGVQRIGRQALPALALTVRPAPSAAKRRPAAAETLYLAFPDAGDFAAVCADLRIEWGAPSSEA